MSQHRDAPARPLYDYVEGLRIRRGWTKTQLARAAKTDRGTIDKWANQPRSPLPQTVKAVAEALGIDQEEALQLAGILRRDEPEELAALSDEELKARLDEIGSELARRREKDERGGGERREII